MTKMDSKKFAWLYLVEHGFAGVKHSYYGGFKPNDLKMFSKYKKSWNWFITAKSEYLSLIKKIGVDWNKTDAPTSDLVSEFNGTFEDEGQKEIMKGTLILKDGQKIEWVADRIEIRNVFDIMANVENQIVKFQEVFEEV